jgi:F0F1-type ATP synthase membrane subunit b/b'
MATEAQPTTTEPPALTPEARHLLDEARDQARRQIAEAESHAERILEEARDQAAELTNAARGEVERKLEWARAQASAIINRAQESAEELLNVAGSVAARKPSEPEDSGPGGQGDKPVR